MKDEIERMERFILDFVETLGYKGVVMGVSGGLDSAVVAGLLSRVMRERVLGLIMPERDSNPESEKHARLVCETFKIHCEKIDITPILSKMGIYKLQPPAPLVSYSVKMRYALRKWKELGDDVFLKDLTGDMPDDYRKGVAYYRAKHRVRMCVLYKEAEVRGYAVAGTTNKTEFLTGFYVKYGDDSVDFEPIGHLYKTQVREIAKELGVPKTILEKPPSPDLIPGVTDEFALGMSYEDIDRILMKMEKGESLDGEDPNIVERVERILKVAKLREIKSITIQDWENFKKYNIQ